MIIVNLKGGLGNQMFQYAIGYCLSKKKGTPLYFDTRLMEEHKIKPSPRNVPRDFDLDVFGIEKKLVKKKDLIKTLHFSNNYRIRKLITIILDKFNLFAFYEKKRIFDQRILKTNYKNLYLDGLWQSENYFKDYRNEILDIYNFDKIKRDKRNINFLNKIKYKNSICLNVRRTDFINNPEHNVATIDFYKKAILKIQSIVGNDIEVYIFSDDLDWCKNNFSFIEKKYYVEHDLAGYKFYNYLYLMSNFLNYIIPNSSFAWWAAWLSQKNEKIVAVPEKWSGIVNQEYIDIIPPSWIKIRF